MAEMPDTTTSEETESSGSLRRPEDAHIVSSGISNHADRTSATEMIELSGLPNRVVETKVVPASKRLWFASLKQWWSFNIDPDLIRQDASGRVVDDPRDFSALERTHLSYVRTSNTLVTFGILMAQLLILREGSSAYGKTLASCTYALAIVLTIASAVRVIRLQNKIISGRMTTAPSLSSLLTAVLAVLLLAIFVVNLLI